MRVVSSTSALLAFLAVPLLAAPVSPDCRCDTTPLSFAEVKKLFISTLSGQRGPAPGATQVSPAHSDPDGNKESDDIPTPVIDGEFPLTTAQLMALSSLQEGHQNPSHAEPLPSAPTAVLPALQEAEALRRTRCNERAAARRRSQTGFVCASAAVLAVLALVVVVTAGRYSRLRRM
ncbi:MAG: hypothetical protein M1837_000792 [Sclerophora amabilis]|nr:MAG: hypothetical protein M1837_000792 [Sclerophora amabilis]